MLVEELWEKAKMGREVWGVRGWGGLQLLDRRRSEFQSDRLTLESHNERSGLSGTQTPSPVTSAKVGEGMMGAEGASEGAPSAGLSRSIAVSYTRANEQKHNHQGGH